MSDPYLDDLAAQAAALDRRQIALTEEFLRLDNQRGRLTAERNALEAARDVYEAFLSLPLQPLGPMSLTVPASTEPRLQDEPPPARALEPPAFLDRRPQP